jgi:hypothetical protein
VVVGVFSQIRTVIETVLGIILGIIRVITGIIKGDWDTVFKGLWTIVVTVFNGIVGTIRNAGKTIVAVAKTIWGLIPGPVKTALMKAWGIVKTVVGKIKGAFEKLKPITGKVKGVFDKVNKNIATPVKRAWTTVQKIVKKIKEAFNKMKLKIPKPKLPSIKVTWKETKALGKTIKYPSLSWNAKGAIFRKPTLLGGNQGVGEAGAEAALPLKVLWDEMGKQFDKLANEIINGMAIVSQANAVGGGSEITIPIYLYPSGPKMGEQIVNTYDTYKRRLRGK